MTREEQIAELIRHRKEVQNDFGWNTSTLNALDAAIEALKAEPNIKEKAWEEGYSEGYIQCRNDYRAEALKAEPCGDAVSREAIMKILYTIKNNPCDHPEDEAIYSIEHLPSVTPERPKGVWVSIDEEPHEEWECDHCGFVIDGSGCIDPIEYRGIYKYCPNCGRRMVE